MRDADGEPVSGAVPPASRSRLLGVRWYLRRLPACPTARCGGVASRSAGRSSSSVSPQT